MTVTPVPENFACYPRSFTCTPRLFPSVGHCRSFLPFLVSLVSLSFLGPSVTHSVPSDVPQARGDE